MDVPKLNAIHQNQSWTCAKEMIVSSFRRTGCICCSLLKNKKTVNTEWYTTICLPKVPRKQILLNRDNAPEHSVKSTTEFLRSARTKLISHSPYSPDLVIPCDFFLFPTIKRKLREIHFSVPEEAVNVLEEHVNAVSADIWAACFTELFERMWKCVKCIICFIFVLYSKIYSTTLVLNIFKCLSRYIIHFIRPKLDLK